MPLFPARIEETRLLFGEWTYRIACSNKAVPTPGRFVLAVDGESVLGTPVFGAGEWEDGFIAISSRPGKWVPGTKLLLYSPRGRGFSMPEKGNHLALISLGGSFCFLWPLVSAWLQAGKLATLFSETIYPDLPAELEAAPLTDLAGLLGWADFIAAALPADRFG